MTPRRPRTSSPDEVHSASWRIPRPFMVTLRFAAIYVLILVTVRGLRTVTETRSGQFTADQVRARSEPVCRLFDAPSEASSWLTAAWVVYGPGGGVRQRLWSVDCTGPMDRWGRMPGAVVHWDADTGDLDTVSHAGMRLNPTVSEIAPELNTDRAVLISYHWLERLALVHPGNPWTQDSPPNTESHSWQVRWHNRSHVCLVKVNVYSGDLVLLRLYKRDGYPIRAIPKTTAALRSQ
jgi:hypothetical protein